MIHWSQTRSWTGSQHPAVFATDSALTWKTVHSVHQLPNVRIDRTVLTSKTAHSEYPLPIVRTVPTDPLPYFVRTYPVHLSVHQNHYGLLLPNLSSDPLRTRYPYRHRNLRYRFLQVYCHLPYHLTLDLVQPYPSSHPNQHPLLQTHRLHQPWHPCPQTVPYLHSDRPLLHLPLLLLHLPRFHHRLPLP